MYEFMIHMIIACVFGVCMGGCIAGWVIIIKKLIGSDPARLLSLEEMYEELIYGR